MVVLIGAKTGRDGIGGVSVLASATFDEARQSKRPSVQVGDPFTEKLLIECCLELYDGGLVVGIQDLGGAGLTCALTETGRAGDGGMRVDLERVPLREPSMRPEEMLASESQERMLRVVTPEKLAAFLAVCASWGVLATAIGEVTDDRPADDRLARPTRSSTCRRARSPTTGRSTPGRCARPADLDAAARRPGRDAARRRGRAELRATVLRMIAAPNLCDKTWVTEQYDRYVLGNTVLAQPEDAGVIRIDEATGRGVALAHRRQRPVRPARPVRRGAAGAGRGVPQRGRPPAPSRSR